jgi:hypothetical protein
MSEKRKASRLKEDNEVTIVVVSGREPLPKEKIIYNSCKDLSVSGARINAHILLPVDTLIKIDITLKTVHQMITVMGKVKWIKIICNDESYEEGVEFVNTADEAIKKLKDYISWKQKNTCLKPI